MLDNRRRATIESSSGVGVAREWCSEQERKRRMKVREN